MKVYLLDDLYEKEFNASYKAKIDVNDSFLKSNNNTELFSFYRFKIPSFGNNKILRYIRLRSLFRLNQLNFLKLINKIQKDDIIVVPFPFEYSWFVLLTSYVFNTLKRLKKEKNIKVIYVVHDLISLRFPDLKCEDDEFPLLDIADVIIVHNPTMINWLIEKGVSAEKLINLQLFDYISPAPASYSNNSETEVVRKVIYAGNLMPWKTGFLYKWAPNYDVELYGVGLESKDAHPRISYKGAFNPDKPIIDVTGISFGLVWDGPTADELVGPGAYLRYNNPHKASLYLSQELPIIVAAESALAPFVLANNLGFTISKLSDIDEVINNIALADYLIIKDNVIKVAKELRNGDFMSKALNKAMHSLTA